MLVLSQAGPSTSGRCNSCCTVSSAGTARLTTRHNHSIPTLFSKKTSKTTPFSLTLATSSDSNSIPTPVAKDRNDTVLVVQDDVPLEGVIQYDKNNSVSSSRFQKWGIVLLAGGDVLALFMFAAIGRFSHGFTVFDAETLRTADPFIAGWFLSAYFLGGYGEDGRGMNGSNKAVSAAAKSWALGIPPYAYGRILARKPSAKNSVGGNRYTTQRLISIMIGLGIRALTSGHLPPTNFALATLGSTAVLLIGWRALLFQILPNDRNKRDDVYRKGSPFELFELLSSLVRRW